MSINTTLAGLSQTASLNGPDGSADLPSSLDDAIRYSLSFTAMLRDGVGFTAGAAVAALGFTPVQQGTGTSQTSDTVKIGWDSISGNGFRIQVNATDFGKNWPINVTGSSASCTGNAATATNATTATTASNANALGGFAAVSYMQRASANFFTCSWTGARLIFGVDGNYFGNVMPMDISGNAASSSSCSGNAATCTTATNSSALGGIAAAGWVQNAGSVTYLQNSGFSSMNANIGGTVCFWGMSVSDGTIKEAVAPTEQDSLAKVSAIDFVQYRFKRLPGDIQVDDGHLHKVGLIAQQAETIDPEWIVDVEGGYKQPDTYALLMSAMHAIKQLNAKVAALEAKLGGAP
jgi:Chaperone of endosialidase